MDPPTESTSNNGIAMSKYNGEEDEEEDSFPLEPEGSPLQLRRTAYQTSCCIFRVPHFLARNNETAYEPKLVSIGPYHRHKSHLKMIEEHKQHYLEFFMLKALEKGVKYKHFVALVTRFEQLIRDSYSENLDYNQRELVTLMIRDGCFILMLLLAASWKIRYRLYEDPIFMTRWILPTFRSDLLLLENQVPLFLLVELLKTSKLAPNTSVNEMAFEFFSYSIKRPQEFWEYRKEMEASHLLDLIRKTFIPPITRGEARTGIFDGLVENSRSETLLNTCLSKIFCSEESIGGQTSRPFLRLINPAMKLQRRGIKFKKRMNVDTPLDICFKEGLLEIPQLVFDDFISSLMINCVAFEQCNLKCSTEMTSYAIFMGCLINTQEDATYLAELGIVENHFGMGEQVSLFFKNIGKDIQFTIYRSYLASVFVGVNKHPHFKVPWTVISSWAASILLILTILQTFFAAYAFFHPSKYN